MSIAQAQQLTKLGDPSGRADAKYWDEWFTIVRGSFEWYCSPEETIRVILMHIKEPRNVIHPGSGTSSLPTEMLKTFPGSKHVVVDVSSTAMEAMRAKSRHPTDVPDYQVGDVLKPPLAFPDKFFDVWVDKGLVDAAFSSTTPPLQPRKPFAEPWRLLKTDGIVLVVTNGEAHSLRLVVENWLAEGWTADLHVHEMAGLSGNKPPLGLVLTKGSCDPHQRQVVWHSISGSKEEISVDNATAVNTVIARAHPEQGMRKVLATIDIKPADIEVNLVKLAKDVKERAWNEAEAGQPPQNTLHSSASPPLLHKRRVASPSDGIDGGTSPGHRLAAQGSPTAICGCPEADYWDQWFIVPGSFEWYCSATETIRVIHKHCRDPQRVIHPGSGTSSLPMEFLKARPESKHVIVDISFVAVEAIKAKTTHPSSIDFHVGDVRKQALAFPDESFDVWVDKGLVDAAFSSTAPPGLSKKMFSEAQRVLRTDGIVLVVTIGEAHSLRLVVENWLAAGWTADLHVYEMEGLSGNKPPLGLVLTKGNLGTEQRQVIWHSASGSAGRKEEIAVDSDTAVNTVILKAHPDQGLRKTLAPININAADTEVELDTLPKNITQRELNVAEAGPPPQSALHPSVSHPLPHKRRVASPSDGIDGGVVSVSPTTALIECWDQWFKFVPGSFEWNSTASETVRVIRQHVQVPLTANHPGSSLPLEFPKTCPESKRIVVDISTIVTDALKRVLYASLPFPEKSCDVWVDKGVFDAAFSSDSPPLQSQRLFSEAQRVLKADGIVLVVTMGETHSLRLVVENWLGAGWTAELHVHEMESLRGNKPPLGLVLTKGSCDSHQRQVVWHSISGSKEEISVDNATAVNTVILKAYPDQGMRNVLATIDIKPADIEVDLVKLAKDVKERAWNVAESIEIRPEWQPGQEVVSIGIGISKLKLRCSVPSEYLDGLLDALEEWDEDRIQSVELDRKIPA